MAGRIIFSGAVSFADAAVVIDNVDAVLCGIAGDFPGSGIQPLFADTVSFDVDSGLASARGIEHVDILSDWSAGDSDRFEL